MRFRCLSLALLFLSLLVFETRASAENISPQDKQKLVLFLKQTCWQPFANMGDYTATKAAILNMTVSLAREFARTGVTVNTVSPGIIVTESTEQYFRKVAKDQGWPDDWGEIEKRVIANFLSNSSGRLGKPIDVANVVALITSFGPRSNGSLGSRGGGSCG